MSKIGRNDPCICGSGKKYKKCCLPAVERRDIETMRPVFEAWARERLAEAYNDALEDGKNMTEAAYAAADHMLARSKDVFPFLNVESNRNQLAANLIAQAEAYQAANQLREQP